MSKKLGCSRSTVRNILKDSKNPMLNYKRKKRPDRTSLQRLLARRKCRRLYYKYCDHSSIMDDESYFTFAHSTLTGNNNFFKTSDDVKYFNKANYEKK